MLPSGGCPGTSLEPGLHPLPQVLLHNVRMGIGKHQTLIPRCGSALVCFEIGTHRLFQYGMPQVLLSAENPIYGGTAPPKLVGIGSPIALLRMVHLGVGRRNQHLTFGEDPGNDGGSTPLVGQLKNTAHHIRRHRVHHQPLLVLRCAVIAVWNAAAAPQALCHAGMEHRLNFVAGVLGIPLIHNVQKWGEIVVQRSFTVHAVVDGEKTHLFLREQHLGIEAHLKVVSPQAAHVLDDDRGYPPSLYLLQKGLKARSVEVSPGVSVVGEVADVAKAMLNRIVFQIHLLESDLSRVFSPRYITLYQKAK